MSAVDPTPGEPRRFTDAERQIIIDAIVALDDMRERLHALSHDVTVLEIEADLRRFAATIEGDQ